MKNESCWTQIVVSTNILKRLITGILIAECGSSSVVISKDISKSVNYLK